MTIYKFIWEKIYFYLIFLYCFICLGENLLFSFMGFIAFFDLTSELKSLKKRFYYLTMKFSWIGTFLPLKLRFRALMMSWLRHRAHITSHFFPDLSPPPENNGWPNIFKPICCKKLKKLPKSENYKLRKFA